MRRATLPIALVVAALVAAPAEGAHITKRQARAAAKTVTIRENAKRGITLKRSDLTARCRAAKGQVNTWRCAVDYAAQGGQCTAKMTIFEVPGKGYRVRKFNFACVK
jgi:hypothetical protein